MPHHFVNKYGADIVRLWAASVEFTNEVPFSEEVLQGARRCLSQFRNILRILLANPPADLALRDAQASRIPTPVT